MRHNARARGLAGSLVAIVLLAISACSDGLPHPGDSCVNEGLVECGSSGGNPAVLTCVGGSLVVSFQGGACERCVDRLDIRGAAFGAKDGADAGDLAVQVDAGCGRENAVACDATRTSGYRCISGTWTAALQCSAAVCRTILANGTEEVGCSPAVTCSTGAGGGGGGGTGGGGSSSVCPTTAACGCSGKNKSPCQADPCCRWTVGSGCGCR